MIDVLFNGYYLSEGDKWVDVHAGHQFEGYSYSYLKFNDNGSFVEITRNQSDFDFESFLLSKTNEELLQDTSIVYGKYRLLENRTIEFVYNVWGEERTFSLTVLSPEVLLNENLKEYRFRSLQ